ncbi:helix-turn-helix domain-containing protein [Aeromonas hydrophila]
MEYFITKPALVYYASEAVKAGVPTDIVMNTLGFDFRGQNLSLSDRAPANSVYPILRLLHETDYQEKSELYIPAAHVEAKDSKDLHFALYANCSDIISLLQLSGEICKKNFSNINFEFEVLPTSVIFYLDYIDNQADFYSPQSYFVMVSTLISLVFGVDIKDYDIEIGFTQRHVPDPDNLSLLATDRYRCRVARTYIKLPKSIMSLQNSRHNSLVVPYLRNSFDKMYAHTEEGDVLISKITSRLSLYWESGKSANIDEIANELGMSRSTLYRALMSRKITFSSLVDSQRKEFAINNIKNRGLSIAEISDRLGYANVSAFTRAFTRWYNISPSKMR